jgi:phosphoribosylglycinamide formyltransferase 1
VSAGEAAEAKSAAGPAAGSAAGHRGGSGPVFRLAVLASGSGTNLQAIIDRLHGRPAGENAVLGEAGGAPQPAIEVVLVVSDQPAARALERARAAGIATAVLPAKDFATRPEHDRALIAAVAAARPDLVVLAGYMRLVAPEFVKAFRWRVINLHPALLPSFPGTTSIADALVYGVKITGVTVHYVDEGLDTGAIIAQEPVPVEPGDTPDSLAARIHSVEHELLPSAIRLIAAGRVRPPLPGSRVVQVDWSGRAQDAKGGVGD